MCLVVVDVVLGELCGIDVTKGGDRHREGHWCSVACCDGAGLDREGKADSSIGKIPEIAGEVGFRSDEFFAGIRH